MRASASEALSIFACSTMLFQAALTSESEKSAVVVSGMVCGAGATIGCPGAMILSSFFVGMRGVSGTAGMGGVTGRVTRVGDGREGVGRSETAGFGSGSESEESVLTMAISRGSSGMVAFLESRLAVWKNSSMRTIFSGVKRDPRSMRAS